METNKRKVMAVSLGVSLGIAAASGALVTATLMPGRGAEATREANATQPTRESVREVVKYVEVPKEVVKVIEVPKEVVKYVQPNVFAIVGEVQSIAERQAAIGHKIQADRDRLEIERMKAMVEVANERLAREEDRRQREMERRVQFEIRHQAHRPPPLPPPAPPSYYTQANVNWYQCNPHTRQFVPNSVWRCAS